MREKIENVLIEKVVNRQETANEKILREIGETLGAMGELNASQLYTIKQQLKYDENLDKIIKILVENSKLTRADILKMFEAKAKVDYEFAEVYYNAKNVSYLPYEGNVPLRNKVSEIAIATFNDFFGMPTYSNIAKTTGITFLDKNGNKVTKNIIDAYKEIVDDTIMNVSTGKESFYTSLANQLKTIGQSGIQQIEYESGYHRRIDSALRMNLQDGLNDLAMAQQELMGAQFGSDGVEVTVHDNPAPDHAPIQGHVFSIEEFTKLQAGEIAKDVDGQQFKTERAIGQWNCYHYTMATVLGVNRPQYSKSELAKIIKNNEKGFTYENKHYTFYEGQQTQRKLETEIRKAREAQITQKAAMSQIKNPEEAIKLTANINKTKKRIDTLLYKYHDFSKKSGLPTKLNRTRVLTKK